MVRVREFLSNFPLLSDQAFTASGMPCISAEIIRSECRRCVPNWPVTVRRWRNAEWKSLRHMPQRRLHPRHVNEMPWNFQLILYPFFAFQKNSNFHSKRYSEHWTRYDFTCTVFCRRGRWNSMYVRIGIGMRRPYTHRTRVWYTVHLHNAHTRA